MLSGLWSWRCRPRTRCVHDQLPRFAVIDHPKVAVKEGAPSGGCDRDLPACCVEQEPTLEHHGVTFAAVDPATDH